MSRTPARRPHDCKLLAAGDKRVRAFAKRVEAVDPAQAAIRYLRGLFAAGEAELDVPHVVEVAHPNGAKTEYVVALKVTVQVYERERTKEVSHASAAP